MRCVLTQLQGRAAPCTKFPPAPPNCRSFAMAAVKASKSRCPSAGISAAAVWGRCNATSTRRFWRPIWIQQTSLPRVPGTSPTGKVRRRACGQHTSDSKNVRMRGRSCPEALASPEPERVCPKVRANPHKSQSCCSGEEGWKRGRNAPNPPCFSRGSTQDSISICYNAKQ